MRAELRSSVRPDRWLAYYVNRTKQGLVVAFGDITQDVVSRDFPEEGLALLQTTIDALSAHVAVLDNERAIRVVNPAWRDFAKAGGLRDANGGLGSNYLEVCRRAGPRVLGALAVMRRLKQVISGAASEARHLYACDTPRACCGFRCGRQLSNSAAPGGHASCMKTSPTFGAPVKIGGSCTPGNRRRRAPPNRPGAPRLDSPAPDRRRLQLARLRRRCSAP